MAGSAWFPGRAGTAGVWGFQHEVISMTRLFLTVREAVARGLGRREEGATLAEYGLLLALIAVVCIAAVTLLGTQISSMFSTIAGSV
jgi:pilus assembly protein Flp/PilA